MSPFYGLRGAEDQRAKAGQNSTTETDSFEDKDLTIKMEEDSTLQDFTSEY